jgi:hypothetical protein
LTCLRLSLEDHPDRRSESLFYVEKARSRAFLDLLASSGFRASTRSEIVALPENHKGIQSYI